MRKWTSWPGFCKMIKERDGFKCLECGDAREMIEIERNEKVHNWGVREPFRRKEDYRIVKSWISNLEVDHIKEVAAGGDMWDLKNCRTLCYKCHKKKTKHFNSKRKTISAVEDGKQSTLEGLNGTEKMAEEVPDLRVEEDTSQPIIRDEMPEVSVHQQDKGSGGI
jgi:hypothetical protein